MMRVVTGFWLSLVGSGCAPTDTALAPAESGWRLPADSRVEQLEAHTAERDMKTSVGQMCSGFRLTANEVLWFLNHSREISWQELEWLPCEVSGRLHSDQEPSRDIHFTISAEGTAQIQEGERTFYLQCEKSCDSLLRDR